MKSIALLTLLAMTSCGASIAANLDDVAAPKRPVIQGRIQKKDGTVKHTVDLEPAVQKHEGNSFEDISASMPAAAVHEDLKRKNELPSAQTSILRPGAAAGAIQGIGAVNAAQASGSQGGASEALRGNGVASPDTKGAAENKFYR